MWEKTYEVLKEYAIELRNTLQDSYINDDRIATGDLLNSVEYIIEKDDRQIEVSLQLKEWWKYVEHGRKPGKFPPPDKILEWVKAKPILPKPDNNGKLPTPNQLAYLIGRKISEVGTTGTHNVRDTVRLINERYEEKIGQAINEDINNELDVIFSQSFK